MGWWLVGLWGALAGEWVVTVCQICMLNTKGKVEGDERLNPIRFDLFPSNHAKKWSTASKEMEKYLSSQHRSSTAWFTHSVLFQKHLITQNKQKIEPRLSSFQNKLKPPFWSWPREVNKVLHASLRNKVVQSDVRGSANEREKERKTGKWRGELCHMNTKQHRYPGSLARVPAAMTWQTGRDVHFVSACLWIHLLFLHLTRQVIKEQNLHGRQRKRRGR